MTMRRRTTRVFIGGIQTPVHDIRTDHGVKQPVGTGSLTMRAPRPPHVKMGAPVRIEAGYDGNVRRIFDGRIPEHTGAFGESGGRLRVELEGHGRLLGYPNRVDNFIAGPVTLSVMFRTFCKHRGVPLYFADNATNPDGTALQFGGLAQVDNGYVPFLRRSSPGADLSRLGGMYGYYRFDTPSGVHRLQKVSGSPSGFYEAAFRTYRQGVDMREVERIETLDDVINAWEILGAEYTASDGSEQAIRSTAATITGNPLLGPFGINADSIKDDAIVTTAMANHCRNVKEVDSGEVSHQYSWTVMGDPELRPGHVVTVESPTVNGTSSTAPVDVLAGLTPVSLWVMGVSHDLPEKSGWTTTLTGWAGTGTAFPAGNDCVSTEILGSTGRHFGNEYLSHYRRPNPDGLRIRIPFPVAADYSTMTIRGFAHGSNSFVRNQSSDATRFEVWQPFVDNTRPVASGEMPSLKENLEQRLNYSLDSTWDRIVVPMSGSLRADPTGSNTTFEIVSGKDSDVGDHDDGEVRNIVLTTCGVGQPEVIL